MCRGRYRLSSHHTITCCHSTLLPIVAPHYHLLSLSPVACSHSILSPIVTLRYHLSSFHTITCHRSILSPVVTPHYNLLSFLTITCHHSKLSPVITPHCHLSSLQTLPVITTHYRHSLVQRLCIWCYLSTTNGNQLFGPYVCAWDSHRRLASSFICIVLLTDEISVLNDI